jgi:hypothetical protein
MRNIKKIIMLVGTVIFMAYPALAQQVTTAKGTISEVKTSDSLAPPEADAPGGKLLPREDSTESRLHHRSLVQKRISTLRNYLATTVLSTRERLRVENSVKEMEASLSETEGANSKEASGTQSPVSYSASGFNESVAKIPANSAFNSANSLQDGKKTAQADKGQENTQGGTKKEEKRFFDTRRFSLSGGIVFSQLERREFQPVLGIARDANGTPTNGNTLRYVIGLKQDNDWSVGPILLLNTKLWERADRNFGISGSVGITGKRDTAGTDIDYFFGPSISIIRGLVYFSGGLYVGKQQRLAGDAYLSAPIDKGDTVPVVKEYHSKPGFSVTFRIFPLPD